MNILQKYIAKSYISSFLLGMVVLTFVLSIGLLVKATQLVIKGLEPELILNFLAVSIPESFSFTIPLAVLVSALLVFGRLSTDGEMSAIKACGINLWNVMVPLLIFGLFLTGLSVYVNSVIAPKGYYARHLITSSTKGTSIIKLLEPGRYIDELPGKTLRFEKKDGDMLYNVLIYNQKNSKFSQEIRSEKALVIINGNDITLDMFGVRISPISPSNPGTMTLGRYSPTITNVITKSTYNPKPGAFSNADLQAAINDLTVQIETNSLALLSVQNKPDISEINQTSSETNAIIAASDHDEDADPNDPMTRVKLASKKRSEMKTELNRRFALGVAPIAFLLIGIPLGMKTSRKESNTGVAISMSVMLIYYAFMIMAKSLAKRPDCLPHLIIWIPPIVCLTIAVILIRKNQ